MREESPANGKIKVKLISPQYPVVEMEADKVLLPGEHGDILILPERAPIFLTLTAGRMIIYNNGQEPISYLVSRGVCEVRRNLCPVLAWATKEDETDPEKVAEMLDRSLEVLSGYHSAIAREEAASRIDFFEEILTQLGYDYAAHVEDRKHAKKTRK